MTDDRFILTYMPGVIEIKPVEHFATWLSHDEFEVRSDFITMTGCRGEDLGLLTAYLRPLTFTNERPPAPRLTVWGRICAALTRNARG